MDLGHKGPSNLPMVTREHAFMLNGELDIGNRPATLTPREDIVGVVVQDVEVGLKR